MTGGFDVTDNVVATAELFDPTTGTFMRAGSMKTARASRAAILLDSGNVLVAGGEDINTNGIATAEVFDPATGSFSTTGTMGTARSFSTGTLLLDGGALVIGGMGVSGCCVVSFTSSELYH